MRRWPEGHSNVNFNKCVCDWKAWGECRLLHWWQRVSIIRSLPDDSTSAISTLGVHDDDEDNDDGGDEDGDLWRCEFWDGDDDDDVDDDGGGWWLLGDAASDAVAVTLGTACFEAVDVASDSDVNRESDKEDDDVNP